MFGTKRKADPDPRVKRQLDALGVGYELNQDASYSVFFELDDGRSQQAFIESETSRLGDFEIRDVWSVAYISKGPLDAELANYLLHQNSLLTIGAWELVQLSSDEFAVAYSNKILADCDPDALAASLSVVLNMADELEKNLDIGDEF